jgi:hypothetical protein
LLTRIFILLSIVFFISCGSKSTHEGNETINNSNQSSKDSLSIYPREHWHIKDSSFGSRYILIGDFDGDNRNDTLVERFLDSLTYEEKYKYYPVEDFMELQEYNHISLINDPNQKIADFTFRSNLGLAFVEVLPDINENGRQEIGYVSYFAQHSTNWHYCIIEYINNEWVEIHSFIVKEWDLPYPTVEKHFYGSIGKMNIKDSLSYIILDNPLNRSYINKVGTKLIEYESYYFDDVKKIEISSKYKGVVGFWFKIIQNTPHKYIKNSYFHLEEFNDQDIEIGLKDPYYLLNPGEKYLFKIEFK